MDLKTGQQILDQAREEFEKKFFEIMGCETDPNGKENIYLIRDESDRILAGINFADEMKGLLDWHISTLKAFIEAEVELLSQPDMTKEKYQEYLSELLKQR